MTRIAALALKEDVILLGIIAPKGRLLDLDISDEQLPLIQAAVDSGDFEIEGHKATPPVLVDDSPKKGKR